MAYTLIHWCWLILDRLLWRLCVQVPFTDLVDAAKCVVKALFIREKYMVQSLQTFYKTTGRSLQELSQRALDDDMYEDLHESPGDSGVWVPRHVYRAWHKPALMCVCVSLRHVRSCTGVRNAPIRGAAHEEPATGRRIQLPDGGRGHSRLHRTKPHGQVSFGDKPTANVLWIS